MQAQLIWLVNSQSGSGRGLKLLQELSSIGQPTQAIIFSSLAEQLLALDKYQTIVIAGGDGTISSILATASALNLNTRFAVYPLGTGNDLARTLKSNNMQPEQFAERLLTAVDQLFQLWKISWGENQRVFANYFSFGYDGAVIRDFSSWRDSRINKFKNVLLNRLMYFYAGLKNLGILLKGSDFTISNKQQTIYLSTSMRSLIFANIKSVIGLGESNSESNPYDQTLELCSSNSILSFLGMIFSTVRKYLGPKLIAQAGSWQISSKLKFLEAQVDGEYLLIENPTEIKIEPYNKIRICYFD